MGNYGYHLCYVNESAFVDRCGKYRTATFTFPKTCFFFENQCMPRHKGAQEPFADLPFCEMPTKQAFEYTPVSARIKVHGANNRTTTVTCAEDNAHLHMCFTDHSHTFVFVQV